MPSDNNATDTAPASPSYDNAPRSPSSPSLPSYDNASVLRDLADARVRLQTHVEKYHSLDSAEERIAWDDAYDHHQAKVDALIAQRDSLRRADDKARVVEILGYDEHRDGVLQPRYLEEQLRRAAFVDVAAAYDNRDIVEVLLVHQHFIVFATRELADVFKLRHRVKLYSRIDADVQAAHTIRLVAPEYDVVARDKLNEAGELVRALASIDDELARIGAVRDPVTGVPKLSPMLLDASYYAQPETLRAWKRARSVGAKLKSGEFEVLFHCRPAATAALIARLDALYQQESDVRLRLRSIQALDRIEFVF
jgi:hypothetical protein